MHFKLILTISRLLKNNNSGMETFIETVENGILYYVFRINK